MSTFLAKITTKMFTFLGKISNYNVLNHNHDYTVDIFSLMSIKITSRRQGIFLSDLITGVRDRKSRLTLIPGTGQLTCPDSGPVNSSYHGAIDSCLIATQTVTPVEAQACQVKKDIRQLIIWVSNSRNWLQINTFKVQPWQLSLLERQLSHSVDRCIQMDGGSNPALGMRHQLFRRRNTFPGSRRERKRKRKKRKKTHF